MPDTGDDTTTWQYAAEQFGWWRRPATPGDHAPPTRRWVTCPPGAPGATPDLARVAYEATWDPDACQWRYPVTAIPDTSAARPGYAVLPDTGDGRPDTTQGILTSVPHGRVTWRCPHTHRTAAAATGCAEAHLACLLDQGLPLPQPEPRPRVTIPHWGDPGPGGHDWPDQDQDDDDGWDDWGVEQ